MNGSRGRENDRKKDGMKQQFDNEMAGTSGFLWVGQKAFLIFYFEIGQAKLSEVGY